MVWRYACGLEPLQGSSLWGCGSPRVETPISANLIPNPSMGEWLLSRRDMLIVARHEVPGRSDAESPVPEGRPKSSSVPQIFVVETEARHEQATARRSGSNAHAALETPGIPVERYVDVYLSRDPFNRPAGTGLFSS